MAAMVSEMERADVGPQGVVVGANRLSEMVMGMCQLGGLDGVGGEMARKRDSAADADAVAGRETTSEGMGTDAREKDARPARSASQSPARRATEDGGLPVNAPSRCCSDERCSGRQWTMRGDAVAKKLTAFEISEIASATELPEKNMAPAT